MSLRILPAHIINQIAAGEVIDRPSSVIKELIENAIDARATKINIEINRGGRNYICVTDNGTGIEKDDILTSLERYATSKLKEDINDIKFLGFRGEALSSIATAGKLLLISKVSHSKNAWKTQTNGNDFGKLKLTSHTNGTTVQVKDLFFSMPTKLKFLKSEASETSASIELVKKLALSKENISFQLISNNHGIINTQAQNLSIMCSQQRIKDILGNQFIANSVKFFVKKEGITIYGYTSNPNYNASTSLHQYFFVNRRCVRNKTLSLALKIAYNNLIPRYRFPQIVLYLDINTKLIDVNIHPTKAEVKFKDEQKIKQMVINTIKNCISQVKSVDCNPIIANPISFSRKYYPQLKNQLKDINTHDIIKTKREKQFYDFIEEHEQTICKISNFKLSNQKNKDNYQLEKIEQINTPDRKQKQEYLEESQFFDDDISQYPLGFARCQIGRTYIVAENANDLILIDQHVVHERFTLEQIKSELNQQKIKVQILLAPKIINLGKVLTQQVIKKKEYLQTIGIFIESNGISQIIVKQLPRILYKLGINDLIKNLAKNLYLYRDTDLTQENLYQILGDIAWQSSIRAKKSLNLEEMNKILRRIEQHFFSVQRTHGRPMFVKLNLEEIKKFFKNDHYRYFDQMYDL